MAEVKWIKIVTDIFDDEKILLIESMPEADAIIVIWFKLLCLAGKTNSSGVLMLSEKIPYTEEMLATIFRRKLATVQMALKTFERFGMIEIIDNVITIKNWGKHQNLDQIENKKQYMRTYMKEYREKQKLLIDSKTNSKSYDKTNSKTNVSRIEEDIDKEEEIDIDINNILLSNDNNMSVCTDTKSQFDINYDTILTYWNEKSMLPEIRTISNNRKKHLNARIKEHGIEAIFKVIDNCGQSKFMRGENKKGWMASFDWVFSSPNNFLKVLEGNYLDRRNNDINKMQNIYEETMKNLEVFNDD